MNEKWLVLYNALIWLLCLRLTYFKWKTHPKDELLTKPDELKFVWMMFGLFLAYSLFTFFGGDNAKYEKFVTSGYKEDNDKIINEYEYIYFQIAAFVNGNFVLWKLIVYGTSLLMIWLSIKKLQCNKYSTYYAFVLFVLMSHGASRSLLAIDIYLFGVLLLSDNRKAIKLFGILIASLSIAAHTSMVLMVALLPFVGLKINKRNLWLLLISLPIGVAAVNMIFYILADFVPVLGMVGAKLDSYTSENAGNQTAQVDSILSIVEFVFTYLAYAYYLIYAFKVGKFVKYPLGVLYLFRICIVTVLVSFVMLLSVMPNSIVMFYRYVGMLPCFMFITWSFVVTPRIESLNKYRKPLIRLALLQVLVMWCKTLYYTLDQ